MEGPSNKVACMKSVLPIAELQSFFQASATPLDHHEISWICQSIAKQYAKQPHWVE